MSRSVRGSCRSVQSQGGRALEAPRKNPNTTDPLDPMKIAVFGLGYVGVVTAACFARDGHTVIGIDPSTVKVDFLRQGKSPIVEPGLEDLIAAAVGAGRLVAGYDYAAAVAQCDVLMVCVGTPGQANGSLDLTYVRRVVQQIGEQLAASDS